MIKKIRVEDAIGLPLLHDLTAIMEDGFKGVKFKRGHIVKEADIEELKNIGKDHIYVGELEVDQVHEEDAISEIGPLLAGPNIEISEVSEGKINLSSKKEGLFLINRKLLRAINEIGDYTITCKKSYIRVQPGEKLVGARIVPLWTDKWQVEKAKEILNAGPVSRSRNIKN